MRGAQHHIALILLVAGSLSGVVNAACQSCLFDLAGRGIIRGSNGNIAEGTSTKQGGFVRHAGVLPIGLSTGRVARPTMPTFNSIAIDFSGLCFLATKKLISSLNTCNIIYLAADSEADDKEVETKDNNSKVEVEGEIMSSSMIIAIGFYKKWISPLLPPACRFLPTCSQYGVQAIQEFGPTKGVILTAWRLARCSPLGGKGYDPPKWPPVAYTYGRY
ncbi:hypothetical protein HJC23_012147 [Cyclotella cryptica]|uniref:Membrane protein insertion efficiency factor n=1 Tax=Cyclotella cryptica TaxID=29204 RepID=A0ABD3PJ16_9STRA|eukprot:CCRYP_014289-RB/>CCRYP_014289-RB protein AED:0.32 eAED:0.32 QI:135/1/1/1/0.33/0.25/4/1519/217